MLNDQIVVIAATNRLEILDKAFVSRCSQKYEMPLFTADENKKMIYKFLNDIDMTLPENEIEHVIKKNTDQRTIMAETIKLIAEQLLSE